MQVTAAANQDERQWGMFAHLSGMLAYMGFPFGGVIGPLIIYNLNKTDRPFASEQGRHALNFHLTTSIVMLLCVIGIIASYITFIAVVATAPKDATPLGGLFATLAFVFAFFIVYVWTFVLTIVGTVKASGGTMYSYPLTFEFVRQ